MKPHFWSLETHSISYLFHLQNLVCRDFLCNCLFDDDEVLLFRSLVLHIEVGDGNLLEESFFFSFRWDADEKARTSSPWCIETSALTKTLLPPALCCCRFCCIRDFFISCARCWITVVIVCSSISSRRCFSISNFLIRSNSAAALSRLGSDSPSLEEEEEANSDRSRPFAKHDSKFPFDVSYFFSLFSSWDFWSDLCKLVLMVLFAGLLNTDITYYLSLSINHTVDQMLRQTERFLVFAEQESDGVGGRAACRRRPDESCHCHICGHTTLFYRQATYLCTDFWLLTLCWPYW